MNLNLYKGGENSAKNSYKTEVYRNLASRTFSPGITPMAVLCYLHGKRDFADVIKITNWLSLREGDYPGLSM